MCHFSTILIIGIASVLILLVIAGLLIGPARTEPQEPATQPDEASPAPGEGDRRAGGPGFRSQALALAHRDATDTPRRRRRRARQARALSAAEATAITELGEGDASGDAASPSRKQPE